MQIFTILFACIAAFVAYLNFLRGEMDVVSFGVAKITHHILPIKFPQNDSVEPSKWRERIKSVSSPIWAKPDVNIVDIQHDGVVQDDFRLIRLYNAGNSNSEPRDVLLFLHGGGFVVGSVDENDALCKTMAAETGFVVVSAQYSLAPEHPYPRGLNDSMAALHWIRDNIASYGGNPQRIFVSGESAGGNLAIAITARNLDPAYYSVQERVSIIGLLLVYPGTSGNFTLDSFVKYSNFNGILRTSTVEHVLELYKGGVTYGPEEFYLLPMYTPAALLAQFPPTEFVVAEYDCLRDDSLLMAQRMREAKREMDVHVTRYRTAIHGFFGRDLFPEGHRAVVAACRTLLKIARTGSV